MSEITPEERQEVLADRAQMATRWGIKVTPKMFEAMGYKLESDIEAFQTKARLYRDREVPSSERR